MKNILRQVEEVISQVPESAWRSELEKTTIRYHLVGAWAAIIFDPVFAITDYFNIPGSWQTLLFIRLGVSIITFSVVLARRKFRFPSFVIVVVPFVLISLQNAFTYSLIDNEGLLGHNLNYMALFIGAAMFLAWESVFSIGALIISAIAASYFLHINAQISLDKFFVNGGLLLMTVGAFMFALIKTRYRLTVKEIKARLALQISNEEIQKQNDEIQSQNEEIHTQAEKIKRINDNLERLVQQRTDDLNKKNKALEEYAFINAHKLRSPVASILGLVHLAGKLNLPEDGAGILDHLKKSTEELDNVVNAITKTIERAER